MYSIFPQHKERHRRIGEAMSNFYDIEGLSLEKALDIIQTIEDDLIAVIPDHQEMENDYRLGADTYGYDAKADSILHNLMYISDRWGGAFRMCWALGLINEDFGPGRTKILEMVKKYNG